MNTFIHQGHIKFLKSDSKDIYKKNSLNILFIK